MKLKKVISSRPLGRQESYDLEVNHPDHNFYANGIVVSNSHAASYSYLSAYTLFLKYKYPQVFYCECLKMAENKADSQAHVAKIESELKFFGIKLLPPDFTKSKESFSIEGENIRFGFSCIKGVSEKSLSPLKAFLGADKTNKFEVFNAATENKLNIGVLCSLIQAGMLSDRKESRERLVFESQLWNLLAPKEQTFCLQNGEGYDFDLVNMVKNIESWTGENGKPVARKTRFDTIKKNTAKYKEIFNQNKEYPDFARWFYETRLLGYSYSSTLKGVFSEGKSNLINVEEFKDLHEKAKFQGVFSVREAKKGVSGAGNRYIKILLGDETGEFWCMMVGEKYDLFSVKNQDPKEEGIVFLRGTKAKDIVWVDEIREQTQKIYMKLGDIKREN